MAEKVGYLGRLFAALMGRDLTANLPEDVVALQSVAATREMELRERDERIEKMKQEYERVKADRERVLQEAGGAELEKFFKKAASPLSNLTTLEDMAKAGNEVQAKDVLQLVASLAKVFKRAGLEQIGHSGENALFDSQLHQRMSGGAVSEKQSMTIRIPGYRINERVLLKAMVSGKEE